MATTTNVNTGATQPAPTRTAPAAVVGNRRIGLQRSLMLTLVSAAIAFGVLAGIVAWQSITVAYNDYHTLVDEGSVSVDAALRARAAALDHMSAAATYLETTGASQQAAEQRAAASWDT